MQTMNWRGALVAVVAAASLTTVAACGSGSSTSGSTKVLHLTEAGGDSGKSIDVGYGAPFTKETGIKLVRESGTNAVGKLKAMVESGNVTADLFELADTSIETAKSEGLLQNLDYKAIAPDGLNPGAKLPYGMGWQYFATYMAWGAKQKPISTWQQFWDTSAVPGKRAIPDYPSFALPMVLLGDGVKPADLYPLDLDRAFKILDEKKNDLVFWTDGAQPKEMLEGGNVVYATTWDTGLIGNTSGIGYDFTNALRNVSYMVRPKGAKNEAAAMKFLHQMTVAKNQAAALTVAPYTGTSPDLASVVSAAKLKDVPTAPKYFNSQVPTNAKYWATHGAAVEKRWAKFKLSL